MTTMQPNTANEIEAEFEYNLKVLGIKGADLVFMMNWLRTQLNANRTAEMEAMAKEFIALCNSGWDAPSEDSLNAIAQAHGITIN